MGGVKDYDPFAFVAFAIWAFFLYYILSTNSPINPVGTNATITQQFSITYTNTKWMLYLLAPMLPYLLIRYMHQADSEDTAIKSGGFGGIHGFSTSGRIKAIRERRKSQVHVNVAGKGSGAFVVPSGSGPFNRPKTEIEQ